MKSVLSELNRLGNHEVDFLLKKN